MKLNDVKREALKAVEELLMLMRNELSNTLTSNGARDSNPRVDGEFAVEIYEMIKLIREVMPPLIKKAKDPSNIFLLFFQLGQVLISTLTYYSIKVYQREPDSEMTPEQFLTILRNVVGSIRDDIVMNMRMVSWYAEG